MSERATTEADDEAIVQMAHEVKVVCDKYADKGAPFFFEAMSIVFAAKLVAFNPEITGGFMYKFAADTGTMLGAMRKRQDGR
jgi:hypothetical protein